MSKRDTLPAQKKTKWWEQKELGFSQRFALTGDGPITKAAIRAIQEMAASGDPPKPRAERVALMEARYEDWKTAR